MNKIIFEIKEAFPFLGKRMFKLSVYDRIILLNILPEGINNTIYGIWDNFLKELSFNDKEINKINLEFDNDGKFYWTKEIYKYMKISERALSIVRGRFKALKEKELLDDEHLGVYYKFTDR